MQHDDPVSLPPPTDLGEPVAVLVRELAAHLGPDAFAAVCVDLLEGGDRAEHRDALPYLTGFDLSPGARGALVLDPDAWGDHWPRTWGARGLLHVWHPAATPAVLAGLDDPHWRPVEMCLKVCAAHEVAGAGDPAAGLLDHERPRVRAQALRTLAVGGDTEHVAAVRAALGDPAVDVRRRAERALEALADRLDLL